MKRLRYLKSRLRLPARGMSLIELLTSVIIIGIASAGAMELAYVNAFWAANGMNRADNMYVARRFLDVINRDLRSATSIDPLPQHSNNMALTLYRSVDLSKENISGFPTVTTEVIYTVIPDPNSTDLAATDYLIQRQEGAGQAVTVLAGLVGPVSQSTPPLQVFQYSSLSNTSYPRDFLAPSPALPSVASTQSQTQINSIVVNLELKKVGFDSATAAMNSNTNHSFEAIRSEIFLRNISTN